MWSPTHIQVLVKRARGLILKGKNGTNDSFVTIALGKEKYQTSVKEKSSESVEWCEQCELSLKPTGWPQAIPSHGNTAEVVLTALHRNFLGVDEFLGVVKIPLSDFDVYEKPKTKWYPLKCKPGQKKDDYRGELEVRTSFTVKSTSSNAADGGSTADLAGSKKDKHKGSLQSLKKKGSSIGGSLMNLGTKDKNLKTLKKSVSKKVDKVGDKMKKSLSKKDLNKSKDKDLDNPGPLPNKFNMDDSRTGSFNRVGSRGSRNRDPGVESDEEEDDMFKFDALSHRSSGSSLNVSTAGGVGSGRHHIMSSKTSTPMSGSIENVTSELPHQRSHKQSLGTPASSRKDLNIHNISPSGTLGTPRSSRSFLMDTGGSSADLKAQALDEWEAKLLGKKSAAPYKNPDLDAKSIISQGSQNSFAAPSFEVRSLQGPEPPQRNLQPPQETPSGRKKIIPVGSDFESSPSPESPRQPVPEPHSSSSSSKKAVSGRRTLSSVSLRQSLSSQHFGSNKRVKEEGDNDDDVFDEKREEHVQKSATIGMKLKSSYKNQLQDANGRTKSLLNLNQLGKGFKDKAEDRRLGSTRDLRAAAAASGNDLKVSSESLGKHARTHSNGSAGGNALPPSGTRSPRVVLGRETTPTPNQRNRISRELWDRFEGKTREDLIEMIVNLQDAVEHNAKKQADLEDYIDALLTKVIANAPELLQKNAAMDAKYGHRLI